MDANWIIVANASRARLFSQENDGGPLKEVADLVHEATRLRTTDTETDDLGQRAASGTRHGSGGPSAPNGYEPHQTPGEHQVELFAREVAARLALEQRAQRFSHLVLMASPQFLGVLRKLLDPHVAQVVRLTIDKDYTQIAPPQLLERIAERSAKA